jgi:hypothetical protein
MPHAPVAVVRKHLGERGMRSVTLGDARRFLDRRAHEWMAKSQCRTIEDNQLRVDRRNQRLDRWSDAVSDLRGPHNLRQDPSLIERCDAQDALCGAGQLGGT